MLRALAALVEDLGFLPSTHLGSSRNLVPVPSLPQEGAAVDWCRDGVCSPLTHVHSQIG